MSQVTNDESLVLIAEIKNRYIYDNIDKYEDNSITDLCLEYEIDHKIIRKVFISEEWDRLRRDARQQWVTTKCTQIEKAFKEKAIDLAAELTLITNQRLEAAKAFSLRIDLMIQEKLDNGELKFGEIIKLKELLMKEQQLLTKDLVAVNDSINGKDDDKVETDLQNVLDIAVGVREDLGKLSSYSELDKEANELFERLDGIGEG